MGSTLSRAEHMVSNQLIFNKVKRENWEEGASGEAAMQEGEKMLDVEGMGRRTRRACWGRGEVDLFKT